MKYIFLLLSILCSEKLIAQDSTDYESNKLGPFVKNIPHSASPELQISGVCVDKKKYSSCAYFYTPSQEKKAEGKQNSDAKKIGKWTYFYENGTRCGTAWFSKEGNKKGIWKYYKLDGSFDKMIQIKKEQFGVLHQKGKAKLEVPLYKIMEPLSF